MSQTTQWQDVHYGTATDVELLMRLYRLKDHAPRHAIVMVHGGAWTANDRTTPYVLCEHFAERGLLVCSLDFRCGPEHKHPSATNDICAAIRYVRRMAPDWGIDPDTIGLIGSSSGGHLVLHTVLTHNEQHRRSTAIVQKDGSLALDESTSAVVTYVVALWPVSDPGTRYQYAIRTGREELRAAHDGYFGEIQTMRKATIQGILAKQESPDIPNVMIIQPGLDKNVPGTMTLHLLEALQEHQASITYRFMPNLEHAFAYQPSVASTRCGDYILTFVREQLQEQFSQTID